MNNNDVNHKLKMSIKHMDSFNYALYQNGVAPIRGIEIQNSSDGYLDNVELKISTESEYFNLYKVILPPIPNGDPLTLEDPQLFVHGKALAELTEADNITVLVELSKDGEILCSEQNNLKILPYDQWIEGTYSEYLASFVMPNHQLISSILYDSSQILNKWNKNASLEGYQSGDPNRVRDICGAIFSAIKAKNIFYSNPPASFLGTGQRIRTIDMILEKKLATCMDITLLYASCIEAVGLHPVLVMMEEHIFLGIWLRKRSIGEIKKDDNIIDGIEKLRVLSDNNEMVFVECTCMCDDNDYIFDQAEDIATKTHLYDDEKFQYAIDVACSRVHGILPIPFRMKSEGEYLLEISEDESNHSEAVAPAFKDLVIFDGPVKGGRQIENKRDLWESKLLDLTQRNMLLNLRNNGNIEPIMSSHIDELEDSLSDGEEFHLLPKLDSIAECYFTTKDEDGKEVKHSWLEESLKNQSIFEINKWPEGTDFNYGEKLRQEYHSHRLYTFCTETELEKSLTKIYRSARSSQQENGVSSMYLAIGLLKWFSDKSDGVASYAPLILFPIEIVRKSALQGFVLHARDDEAQFNTTLLEMLKQNYNLEIPGLDPLPMDDHGYDIKKVFAVVRHAISAAKDWEVVESCAIGNFSFAQFAMWNDLHTSEDCLDNSNIVRSLMKGHVDWNIEGENDQYQKNYLPITVDGSQLNAIEMAAKGQTFVLHGPPGTGKSQTITAMISNLMAQGKKVLFVAEKMAALSVVQRRLDNLGIGDFCLELHSDKANKKQVFTKFQHVLDLKKIDGATQYDDYLKKANDSRANLDNYAKHLHKVHRCGLSMYQLINLYESVDGENKLFFEENAAAEFTRVDLDSHIPLIKKFLTVTSILGEDVPTELFTVGINNYTAEIRSGLKNHLDSYVECLKEMQSLSIKAADNLAIDNPEKKVVYERILSFIDIFDEIRQCGRNYFEILDTDPMDVEEYFIYQSQFKVQEDKMKSYWDDDFLELEMRPYLEEHISAGKKFFGKASAKASLTAKIQKHCKSTISYEQIPEALEGVILYQKHKEDIRGRYDQLARETKAMVRLYSDDKDYKNAYNKAQD